MGNAFILKRITFFVKPQMIIRSSTLLLPMVFVMPLLAVFDAIDIGISATAILNLVLTLSALLITISRCRGRIKNKQQPLQFCYFFLLISTVLSIIEGRFIFSDQIRDAGLLVLYIALIWAFVSIGTNALLNPLVIASIKLSFSMMLIIGVFGIPGRAFVADNIDFSRNAGLTVHPNVLGLYSCYSLALSHYLFRKSSFTLSWYISLTLLSVLSILLTKSLTALVILILMLLVIYPKLKWSIAIMLPAAIAGFGIISNSVDLSFERKVEVEQLFQFLFTFDVNALNYGSFYWRVLIWIQNTSFIINSPFFGSGIGSFGVISGADNLAHNDYYRFLFEGGLFAFLAFLYAIYKNLVSSKYLGGEEKIFKKCLMILLIFGSFTLNLFNYTPVMTLVIITLTLLWTDSHNAKIRI